MDRLIAATEVVTDFLNRIGEWLPQLFLRLILAWEYWDSGITKYRGENWFEHIQSDFPFPFNTFSVEFSWFLATWSELVGGIALLVGLFTRFVSLSLIVLTVVAALAVHWPDQWSSLAELWQGYAISDQGTDGQKLGNYKLALLFIIMLVPLLFSGAGKLSLDHLLKRWLD